MESQDLAPVAPTNLSCQRYYYSPIATCPNTTFDPSINVTATGTIGVAYTAFTNYTHCPGAVNMTNYTFMDVVFQTSTNGSTWSTPVYLGNQNCSDAANETVAWQPSLTSLANGTFVVAYVMGSVNSNCTGVPYCEPVHPPEVPPASFFNSEIVVQMSYNGGVTWTTPAPVLGSRTSNPNAVVGYSSYCPSAATSPNASYLPSIAASGGDVYLAWENVSWIGCPSKYTADVHYAYSTNGGSTWSAPVQLPGEPGTIIGRSTNYTAQPDVIAPGNGQVYIAYSSGFNEFLNSVCLGAVCFSVYEDTADLMLANSTAGTGPISVHVATWNEPFEFGDDGPFYGYNDYTSLIPKIAWDGMNGQLDMTTVGLDWVAYSCGSGCTGLSSVQVVMFQNSSSGNNWSTPTEVGNYVSTSGATSFVYGQESMPTVIVNHNGTIEVTFLVFTEPAYPGVGYEVAVNSTDNGTTWNGPFRMNAVPMSYYTDAYLGEYGSSAVAPSGQTFYAWTDTQCPGSSTYCYWMDPGYPEPNTTVAVSWAFEGTGITLSFNETNLTAGATWSASLQGNLRSGPAGSTLSVSGVPAGLAVSWVVSWANTTYGISWVPTPAATNPGMPASFTSNSTLKFTYAENVLLNVLTNPALSATYFTTTLFGGSNYLMSPTPGQYWYPVNATVPIDLWTRPISCTPFCDYANLSFQSWTGTGPSGVNSNVTNITVTLRTTLNETATFLWLEYCDGFSGTLYCNPTNDYPLTYQETGLPSGTAWNVTTVANSSSNGVETNGSTTSQIHTLIGQGPASYTPWTVPASGGKIWAPTVESPESPVEEPLQSLVNISYSLVSPTTQSFVANFTATGLPNGTAWSADVGAGSYAVTSGNLTLPVAGGVATALNGSPVYTERGTGYYAASVSVLPYVMNTTWANATVLPDSFTFDGPAKVVVHYRPMYWLDLEATAGGNVSGVSRWVENDANLTLTATASPGHHFLDWTGTGPGATTAADQYNATVKITPTGPVTELATFRVNPQPTWNVTVTALGLPAGVAFGFSLGATSYSTANSSIKIGELLNGSYPLVPETAYAPNSNGTRWVPTSWNGTFGAPGSSGYTIQANGSFQIDFTTQYTLSVASTPGGSVTPSTLIGTTWMNASSSVVLAAAPAFHYKFGGWNASGAAGQVGMGETITVNLTSPVWESASFLWRIFPLPQVYTLAVTETGLPSGTWWNVTAGSLNSSAAGPHSTLQLTHLNGSYLLTVADVYTALGTRYVANGSVPIPANVTANRTATVVFTEQFAVSVSAGQGGSVSNGGVTWVNTGTSVSLTATPAAGYTFLGWNGSGTGAYSGTVASPSALTVSGPINETANFELTPAKQPAANPSAGMVPALGILAGLLVVGLVVGLIVGRRRSSRPPSEPESMAPAEETPAPGTDAAPAESTYGEETPSSGPDYQETPP